MLKIYGKIVVFLLLNSVLAGFSYATCEEHIDDEEEYRHCLDTEVEVVSVRGIAPTEYVDIHALMQMFPEIEFSAAPARPFQTRFEETLECMRPYALGTNDCVAAAIKARQEVTAWCAFGVGVSGSILGSELTIGDIVRKVLKGFVNGATAGCALANVTTLTDESIRQTCFEDVLDTGQENC